MWNYQGNGEHDKMAAGTQNEHILGQITRCALRKLIFWGVQRCARMKGQPCPVGVLTSSSPRVGVLPQCPYLRDSPKLIHCDGALCDMRAGVFT